MRPKSISRRHFLRGAAGALVALPLLEATGCQDAAKGPAGVPVGSAARAVNARPRRFIGALVPNGVVPEDWFPTGGETTFTLGRSTQALAPHRDDIIIFKGVHNRAVDLAPARNHLQGTWSLLTGRPVQGGPLGPWSASGISLDQLLAERLGSDTKLGSLEVSTEGNNLACLAIDRNLQFRLPLTSPLAVFTRLFAAPETDPEKLAQLLARRQSILDRIQGDYAALAQHLGQQDRARVQAHLDAIRDVERRLLIQPAACQVAHPEAFSAPVPADQWMKVMTDLIVLALQCDLTRVVTLAFRRPGQGNSYFPWLPGLTAPSVPGQSDLDFDDENEHHLMTHAVDTHRDKLHTIMDWFMRQTAYLIAQLKAAPDGDTTLFDSTVVLQGSDVGEGLHTMQNIPFVLAGRAGGMIRTGRYLQYGGDGESHNRLLVAVMNAMGVTGTVFGDDRVCVGGPLSLG